MSSSSNAQDVEYGHRSPLVEQRHNNHQHHHHHYTNSTDQRPGSSSDSRDTMLSHTFPSANMLYNGPALRPEVLEPPRLGNHAHGTTLPRLHEIFDQNSRTSGDSPLSSHELPRPDPFPASAYTSPPPTASGEHRGSYQSLHSTAQRPVSRDSPLQLENNQSSQSYKRSSTEKSHAGSQDGSPPVESYERSPRINSTGPRPRASFKRVKSDPEDERTGETFDTATTQQTERPRSSMSARASSNARWLGEMDTTHGRYHFYDDGTCCPAYIAGEAVNPEWGITKAGKPRKRLARACKNCRDKKIKCEPGGGACSQCLKLGKECSRSQEGADSPESGSSNYNSPLTRAPAPLSSPSYELRSGYLTPAGALCRSHEWIVHTPDDTVGGTFRYERGQKRQRSPSSDATPSEMVNHVAPTPHTAFRNRHPGLVDDSMFNSETDPYEADAKLTMSLLENYFMYRDTRVSKLFPKIAFTKWVERCRNKSRENIMLLYAVIAVGSLFEEAPELKNVGKALVRVASAMEANEYASATLQLAQTRLLLTLYHHAKGHKSKELANEYSATAFRVLNTLGYNTEAGAARDVPTNDANATFEYGFNRAQVIECRRRTFWLGYLVDRYSCFCCGHMTVVANEDAMVRLPNEDRDYEEGKESVGPLFNPEEPGLCSEPSKEPGAMALMVGIASLWGDVCSFNYRSMHRPFLQNYEERFDEFYHSVTRRLRHWESHLPPRLKLSSENTTAAIRDQYFLTYFSIQSLYCATSMKLNRFARFSCLPEQTVRRNIGEAHRHARALLEIVRILSQHLSLKRSADLENAMSQPFPGFAILCACDVISCGGTADTLLPTQNHLSRAKAVVTVISRFFQSAKEQRKAIEERELAFATSKYQGIDVKFWPVSKPMETTFMPSDHDLLYGVSKDTLAEAVAELDGPAGGERRAS